LIASATLGSVVKIVTSFTVAHSITLALAALDLVTLPPSVVEPVIALSIIYVGVENILYRDRPERLEQRWLLTFAFGLIHGFGFAGVLRELEIGAGGGGVAVPLVSFNLGVELGQLAIALLVWPLVWKLRAKPLFKARYVTACSVVVALAGGYWLVERTLLK
jgi:hydrogenase/urease accessory protein HupE